MIVKQSVARIIKKTLSILTLVFVLSTGISAFQKVNWETIEWQVLRGERFDIYFPQGYNHLAQITLQYAEEANILISRKLHHHLSSVTPIFVYPSHGHFQSTNIIPFAIDEGTGGFTERIKRRVVVPYLGSNDEYRHVVTHELVHAFQYDILLGSTYSTGLTISAGGQPPLWFVEGMAEYLSLGWDSTVDMQMRDAVLTDTLPTLEMMTEYRVVTGFIFYKGGQSVCRYINDTYGEGKIGEILRDLRDQKGIEEAIKTNLGVTFSELDQGWRRWLKRLYFSTVNKKFDDEEGPLLTRHLDDQSMINLHPAISPDATKVAYLTARGFYPVLVMRDIKDVKKELNYSLKAPKDPTDDEILLVRSSDNYTFFQLHLMSNRLTFTPDSKKLFFSARSQGRDHLILFDIENKKIVKRITPSVDMILHPALSPSGKKAAFVGVTLGVSNVYVVDIESETMQKITHDSFSKKDPTLSADDQLVVFSSNSNAESNIESSEYHLFSYALAKRELRQLTFEKQKQSSAQFFSRENNQELLFVSNHTGIHNMYLLDLATLKFRTISDAQGGALTAQTSYNNGKGKKIVYTQFRQQGFDIALKQAPQSEADFYPEAKPGHEYQSILFPKYKNFSRDPKLSLYDPRITPDFMLFMLTAASFGGNAALGGSIWLSGSDLSGNHAFSTFVDYLNFGGMNRGNFNFNYAYLKHRLRWHAGVFRTNYAFQLFNLVDLTSVNSFFYYPTFIASTQRFGVYGGAEYPITPFDSLMAQVGVSRIDEIYQYRLSDPLEYRRPDTFTNIYSIQYGYKHNNVLYSIIGPLKGFHAAYSGEQSLPISGREHIFNRNAVDLRGYFHLGQRYIFAMRGYAATVNGPEQRYFPWQIGGFNTLRGYDYLSMRGYHSFFFNLEFRYPLIDAIAFGLPVPWVIRGFSGVFFIDGGGAFDEASKFRGFDYSRNEFDDLKMSIGLGARMILFPGLMLKIDWATPWLWRSALPLNLWIGRFSMGYEF